MRCGLISLALLGGCASTGTPQDPFEPINRGIYHFNDTVDHVLLKPAAELYHDILPQFVRTGVSNFFSNINDVLIALNDLLQGKVQDAASDVGRVLVNTTVGVLGVMDVATDMGLEKHDEDFGQTLGRWGVGDGPYLVLPFFGPSNLRDGLARIVDYRTDPITYVDPSRDRNQLWAARIINRRSELLDTSTLMETAALDPYEFLRDAYLQRRRNLIYDGNPPPEPDNGNATRPEPRSDGTGAVNSILFSGEPPTPAQLEAFEKAALAARSRPSAQPVSSGTPHAEASQTNTPGQTRMVRVWLPSSGQ
ncbi:MAG TPA: VacJ family lipoprotein [Burkholderiales bacterium]|nr:VacJ family lipoprotein [Burkholderiales bacterium]